MGTELRVVGMLGDKNQVNNNRIPLEQAGKKGIWAQAPSLGEASISSDEMRQGNNNTTGQGQHKLQGRSWCIAIVLISRRFQPLISLHQ